MQKQRQEDYKKHTNVCRQIQSTTSGQSENIGIPHTIKPTQ